MGIIGDGIQDFDEEIRKLAAIPPFFCDFLNIIIGRKLAGQQEKENPLRKRFFTSGGSSPKRSLNS